LSGWGAWLAVGAGGALGAMARVIVYRLLERVTPIRSRGMRLRIGPGLATVLVNLLGSFALGLLLGVSGGGVGPDTLATAPAAATRADWPNLFWTTGVCGSLTTFSTFCGEAIGLARRGEPGRLALYLAANVGLCLAALAAGMRLTG
jgi:CrcB protein